MSNREVFGAGKSSVDQEKELEMAYQIELTRRDNLGKTPDEEASLEILLNGYEFSGLLEKRGVLVVAPVGKAAFGEAWLYGEKVEKLKLVGGEIMKVPMNKSGTIKLKVSFQKDFRINGKNSFEWTGSGIKKIVFDLRGRPLRDYEPGREQQERIKNMCLALSLE